jgi:hypothetical protein
MKNLFLLLMFTFLLPVTLLAQVVPNGGFETWTNGNPDNWFVNNAPTYYTTVTKSSTAHTGSSSVKGTIVSWVGGLMGPLIEAGTTSEGFAVSQRYKTVSGYYQFNPLQGDKIGLDFSLYKAGSPVAIGAAEITASTSSWTQFNVDFSYQTGDTPDICKLIFTILGPTSSADYHQDSYFLLDDIDLSGTATSVNDKNIIPAKFSLEQNYPNPFNPSTKIQYNLPQNSFVNLTVYNAIGKEMTSLVNGVIPAGSHEVVFNASGLNSGVYFYTLKAGNNFFQTRKMILMK